jgi:hypothetical protein
MYYYSTVFVGWKISACRNFKQKRKLAVSAHSLQINWA